MAIEFVKAMVGIAVLLGAWLVVQRLQCPAEDDALAGRTSCHGCAGDGHCDTACDKDSK